MKNFDINYINNLEKLLKIKIYSNEFRIISKLFEIGPTESLKLRELTGNSISAHNIYLRKLMELKMIDFVKDDNDKRKKYYRISDQFADKINSFGL
jgi:DNA-binding MarR family transcriptional regulator